ncbi:MAG: L-glyceraldehyde 3-phosphate reductase [Candidatus Marinimicrobia bacterium]|nr:L-glyceraldehyde 3-phosphate reductase [Candidatus Neomarinimicrobiota bacterium]
MTFLASQGRYKNMTYNRVGKSGLKLPALSLGLWHNFGSVDNFENAKSLIFRAFDAGITHFDLANNYGPQPGSAEENFGRIVQQHLNHYRDEIIISTKAGYPMWNGPYGDGGSRKYLIASLDQSLKRMGLDYVDIFYSHRFDPDTPLEETMMALDQAVRSGKALYAGISNYGPKQTQKAIEILTDFGTPLLIHQHKYSMFVRELENGTQEVLAKNGIGCIAFSPLAQGMLTDKYFDGIPENSRAAKVTGYLQTDSITKDLLEKAKKLSDLAGYRNQSLAQMALAWVLNNPVVDSVLIGASNVRQIEENIEMLKNVNFSDDEKATIKQILE